MATLSTHRLLADRETYDVSPTLDEFVTQRQRLGLLVCSRSDSETVRNILETLENDICSRNGQCLALDAHDVSDTSIAEHILTALEAWRNGRPFRINLPDILRHNPNSGSLFINRAILWQRLGDRLIEEEEPGRETLLILKNVDSLDAKSQHDVARLVRFHATHRIRRTFLFTIRAENLPFLEPELRQLVDERFEV